MEAAPKRRGRPAKEKKSPAKTRKAPAKPKAPKSKPVRAAKAPEKTADASVKGADCEPPVPKIRKPRMPRGSAKNNKKPAQRESLFSSDDEEPRDDMNPEVEVDEMDMEETVEDSESEDDVEYPDGEIDMDIDNDVIEKVDPDCDNESVGSDTGVRATKNTISKEEMKEICELLKWDCSAARENTPHPDAKKRIAKYKAFVAQHNREMHEQQEREKRVLARFARMLHSGDQHLIPVHESPRLMYPTPMHTWRVAGYQIKG